jgi:RNA polymerase sigma factor (sigma-70 family)
MKQPSYTFTSIPDPGRRTRDTGTLADRYGKDLLNYLARRLWNREDARDLAQEVYLRLLRLGKTDIAADCPSYFFGVAENVVRDFKLRATQQPVTFNSELVETWSERQPHAAPDAMSEELNLKRELKSALSRLPPTCRTVLLLHKRDGLSYAEVAAALDLSPHTVQKYIARSLSLLRKQATRARAPKRAEPP